MNTNKRQLSPIKDQQEGLLKKHRLLDEDVTDNVKLNVDMKPIAPQEKTENYDFLFEDDADFDLGAMEAAAMLQEEQEILTPPVAKLDLSDWTRCVVLEVERERKTFDLVLKLRAAYEANQDEHIDEFRERQTTCRLQGPWSHTRIEVDDLISIKAIWNEQLQSYSVNKDVGFCVINPDTLISSTTVVGSLFCARKAMLADRFKGVDPNNKIMVIGSLVHELLQTVLAKGLRDYQAIDKVSQQLLESQRTAYTLYASRMTREETALELQKFVPNIVNFVQQYLEGGEDVPKSDFKGVISEIQDIEENLWVPQLGLKGKVDVSVRVHRRPTHGYGINFFSTKQNALPLELKTGRATFSMEHKGQVILYQMMLTAAGKQTHSGLLLYLREGILREIEGARNEQRDLIGLRNELSYFLSQRSNAAPPLETSLALGDGKFVQPFELPEPISHHSACGNCAYNTICCSFAQTDLTLQLRSGHPLLKVAEESTAHLQAADYEYFIRWCGLLTLEEQEAKKSNYVRSLWTEKPEVRARNGRAINNLQIVGDVDYEETRYIHTFEPSQTESSEAGDENADEEHLLDLTLSGFSLGEYVIVSSLKRLGIAAGCICNVTKTKISISLERNLLKNYANHRFIVDKHESQSGNVFNFTNLGLLLDNNERAMELRSIIVHLEQPSFADALPKVIATEGAEILKQLNAIQRAAVLKALTTKSFMLIKGLPGTGKTQTLVAIVRLLHLLGKSVLITSHTHSAVDNLMIRLKIHALPMLRLGSGSRISSQLSEFAESELTANCRTESDFARVYGTYNIVGVTCLGSAHSIFLYRNFDFCIVDEATQVMQCTVLRPLFFCQQFILVGDPDQLPPLIRSKEARLRGADESLFQRLDSPVATAVLTLQYRMNRTITKLANHLTYGGNLKCASKDVESAVMRVPDEMVKSTIATKWLQRALQSHIDLAVFFLDTGDCSERSYNFAKNKHSATCEAIELTFADDVPTTAENSHTAASPSKHRARKRVSKYTNYCDAAIILHTVRYLLNVGCDAERIGIIAPYRAQVELLRKLVEQHAEFYEALPFKQIEVNTVDQYQGRDKDIIIYSCAKTGTAASDIERSREAEILEDKRRLTVAITRSKHKLIIVGDAACLQQYTPFSALFARIPSHCKLKLEEGKLEFSWEKLLHELGDVISA